MSLLGRLCIETRAVEQSKMSYSHRKAYVEAIEETKKPETRVRRIEQAVVVLGASKPKK